MQGPSRQALAAAQESLVARAGDADFDGLSDELLAVSALLGAQVPLRGLLGDAGTTSARKQAVVDNLLSARISPLALSVVKDVVAVRWSSSRDLVDALEALGAEAAFVVAERAGRLDAIEDELFRFERTVLAQPELRAALTDAGITEQSKVGIVHELLDSRADPTTVALVTHVVAHPHGRKVETAVQSLSVLAAARRDQLVAEVRVAAPMTGEQEQRLGAALAGIYGREVHLQITVDPRVLGGAVVTVGDEVIDGSISSKLEQARRRFAA